MSVKLPTEDHLEFLSLNGSSESTLVKMPHCWKSHVTAHIHIQCIFKEEEIHETCGAAFKKRKQRKEWTSSHKIYQANCFVGVRYQNVIKLCPPFARFIGSKRFMGMCHPPPLPYLHISSVVTC